MQKMSVEEAVALLSKIVATPSVSGDEAAVADLIEADLVSRGVIVRRHYNNVWALSQGFNSAKPTLMLNSHIDTVQPVAGYSRNPFDGVVEGGRLYGLGSNDAGASVVALLTLFCNHYDTTQLPYNLLLALTAEEETMGERGMRAMLAHLADEGVKVDMALVGEPTQMRSAIGERGLVVLDGVAYGRSGHAAREEGENAIYKAMTDIAVLRDYRFARESEVLGPIKISVTQIAAGTQHNIVPAECRFVVDVRTTDAYTNEEVVAALQASVGSQLTPRSTRIRASAIKPEHLLVEAATMCGCESFISPTTSDRALMSGIAALKIGVGDSARSHTADEYVEVTEIAEGVEIYGRLLANLAVLLNRR